ncbi:PKD domain-containing protein [Daejeonella sp. H1SJ63]|uniref:PKD domain-containing protein n=1 Tax=Daejeonella sp. H1SJ63 TaxID=3034145 RepID=UPI0023EC479E|nr:PKD domain-containing protein [Daejeonella sp. H1SJ63]
MLASKLNYPEFVPDQLLSSEHLNQLFEYLEEQGRLSRTNLIGIGIVCGLELQPSADGKSIYITKGCGVTSEGYLISVEGINYTKYKDFNAVQDRLYNRFVDSGRQPRFHIDELKQDSVEDATSLDADFLKNKIVLLFVEILEEGAKNCNPNSCDDKGINVTVSFKPLLIDINDAKSLQSGNNGTSNNKIRNLDELRMPRFDVPATLLADTSAIFEVYQKVLNTTFLTKTESVLTEAYNTIAPLVLDIYPANPFNNLSGSFNFINDKSISGKQLINIQYYYDLFSDLLLAYEEFRHVATRAISMCCPDSNLFPRHLMLGLASVDTLKSTGEYRDYFIPSPVLNSNLYLTRELRSLFTRMALLIEKFSLPPVTAGDFKEKYQNAKRVRITPTKFGAIPLSEKSIPFYYNPVVGDLKLFRFWNYEKTSLGREKRILSYNVQDYNTSDDDIMNPLNYDLEPNNFLRIEGHVGMNYKEALRSIISIKNEKRLPFEVIALSGDVKSLRTQIKELSAGAKGDLLNDLGSEKIKCQFKDLESIYDTLATGFTCTLCGEMKYFYNMPGGNTTLPAPSSVIPQVPLLKKCDRRFRFKANSLGHEFEIYYNEIKDDDYIGSNVLLNNQTDLKDGEQNTAAYALLYYIEKLSESISSNLGNFDIRIFIRRQTDLIRVAEYLKNLISKAKATNIGILTEDIIDHLDVLIYNCKQVQFLSLYRDYLIRLFSVLLQQKFAFFIRKHPGIQHKAGVSVGGTFILVYHEEVIEPEKKEITNSMEKRYVESSDSTNSKSGEEASNRYTAIDPEDDDDLFSKNDVEVLRELFNEKDINQNLENLIGEIDHGTVIADFYLPYLCYSDCQPINFIINESKPPAEKPSIDIKIKEFCSDDKQAYAVFVSPEGGNLSGEGIVTAADNTVTFQPSIVDLQTGTQKSIKIIYTKDGETVSVDVLVFKKPIAAFDFKGGINVNEISFINKSQFADKFEWDFGDGGTSDENSPKHTYTTNGTFTVKLKVSNGICSNTVSKPIDIKVPVVKTCLTVSQIIEAFKKLESLDLQLFRVFVNAYPSYQDIAAFFKEFEQISTEETDKQIEFLAVQEINARINEWLEKLIELVLNSDLQLIAANLYRILENLTMYISCIQKEDVNSAKVSMAGTFDLIISQIEMIKSLPDLSDPLKELIKTLTEDLSAELTRIKDNKEESSKPVYFEIIQKLLELIKSINL